MKLFLGFEYRWREKKPNLAAEGGMRKRAEQSPPLGRRRVRFTRDDLGDKNGMFYILARTYPFM